MQIAARAYSAFNEGGVEAMLEFLDPEIEWHTWEGFARKRRVFHGHEGVREVLAVYQENIDELRADPLEMVDAGVRLVVPFRLYGRAMGTDEEVSLELVHVWTIAGERAMRLEVYPTKAEALRAAGAAAVE